MTLKQIKPGIYSLNGNPVLNNNLVVAMHPHYLDYNKYIGFSDEKEMKEIPNKMNKFLIEYCGPKIILEEGNKLEETLEKYEKQSGLSNLFFIKTQQANETPSEIDYETLFRYFSEMSANKEIILVGGYNWKMPWNKGCLGNLKDLMRERGLQYKIIQDLTFS